MMKRWTADNSLQHHGIRGQKWGVRNGPPYPLHESSGSSKSLKDNRVEKRGLTEKQKKLIAAGVIGSAVALSVVGGIYLSSRSSHVVRMIGVGKKCVNSSLPLEMNLQYFAGHKAQNRSFKFRNKKEAAIVLNEFRPRNMSREDMKKDVLAKTINIDDQGAYTYFGKNQDGRGTFKIFKRVKVRDSSTGLYERSNHK